MKNTSRTALIHDLKNRTSLVTEQANALLSHPDEVLLQRAAPNKWNALECIEHLNLYGDYYLPEIERRILAAPRAPQADNFKSSWLGNKFAVSMLPAEKGKKLNSMNTFKDKNPHGRSLTLNSLHRFLKQQEHLMKLLDMALEIDLTKTKTSITISKLIKLRLGDTIRVVIYHNERHLIQAQKAVEGQ